MAVVYGFYNIVDRSARFNSTTEAYTAVGSGTTDYAPLLGTEIVGDSLLFQSRRNYAGKTKGMQFNVSTAIAATSFTGVWEYAVRTGSSTTSTTGIGWLALSNVVDNTNGFTTAGINDVTWDVPSYWANYMNPGGNQVWYSFNVRFRITAISGVTDNGFIIDTKVNAHGIKFDGDITMTDLYDADVTNGWGLITKSGMGTFVCDVGIFYTNTTDSFTTNNEMITMINGNHMYIKCLSSDWGLNTDNNPQKGTLLTFEGRDNDYSSLYIVNKNATMYNTTVRFIGDSSSYHFQGAWGAGIGTDIDQSIGGCFFDGFRSHAFTNTKNILKNITYGKAQTEPNGATFIDCKSFGANHAIRPTNTVIQSKVHRLNGRSTSLQSINPWRIDTADWYLELVDCIMGDDLVRWNAPTTIVPEFYAAEVRVVSSYQNIIKDESSSPIDNVNVSIFDLNNILRNTLTTNTDGYISNAKDTVTNASTTDLTWATVDTTNKRSYELIMTNGTAIRQRSVIHTCTATSTNLAEPFNTATTIGDNVVELPYITASTNRPFATQTAGQAISGETEAYYPFLVKFRKYGYISSSFAEDFLLPIISASQLATNTFVTLTEANAALITNITIDGDAKIITFTNPTAVVNDLYDYAQWWHTQTANMAYDEPLLTSDGDVFTLQTGWSLILNNQIFNGINVIGDVLINGTFDLTDHNITGQVTFNTIGTYSITTSIITEIINISGGTVNINAFNSDITTNTGPNINLANRVTLLVTVTDSSNVPIENANVRLSNDTSVILTGLTNASGIITDTMYSYSTDETVTGWCRKSTGIPLYKQSTISGTINSDGFNATVQLILDG